MTVIPLRHQIIAHAYIQLHIFAIGVLTRSLTRSLIIESNTVLHPYPQQYQQPSAIEHTYTTFFTLPIRKPSFPTSHASLEHISPRVSYLSRTEGHRANTCHCFSTQFVRLHICITFGTTKENVPMAITTPRDTNRPIVEKKL